MVGRAHEVPSNGEQVLNDSVNREESLGLLRRLEPAHLSLSLSRRLMRDFGSVVGVTIRDVKDRRHDRPVCRAIASQLVGDQPPRFASPGLSVADERSVRPHADGV